jgi:hypothetical protein
VNNRNIIAKAARWAATLLRHNMLARAARPADNKGVADATLDTLKAFSSLFKEPSVVEDDTPR